MILLFTEDSNEAGVKSQPFPLFLWRLRGELMSGGGNRNAFLLQRLMGLSCIPVRLDPQHDHPRWCRMGAQIVSRWQPQWWWDDVFPQGWLTCFGGVCYWGSGHHSGGIILSSYRLFALGKAFLMMPPSESCFVFCFLFWLCRTACRFLVPWPGIEPMPPAVEARSLNHWTTRAVPRIMFWSDIL